MANEIKKEQEELFRTIYKIATDLVHAGHVAEWDFKSYVLGTMFYRYISENFAAYVNSIEHDAGRTDFDYASMPDAEAETARQYLIDVKGFFILPSELFCNVRARADKDDNLNETLERIFKDIESSAATGAAENDFAGLFDDFDVNAKAIGETVAKRNKVLVELLNGVAQMPLFTTDGINPDLFGDAYEYLMGMYAANAGKKGGQYFTPADVSELLARLGTIGKTKINKVYDPACGSGSLLLKVEKVLGKDNIERGFFGQEIDLTTYNLCRINMFLHNIDFDKFNIVREDTLLSPAHDNDQPFELIVSNPPFSVPWEGDKNATLINDPRYAPAGVLAPASKGDMAFIMHSLSYLANNGAAAIVCFPGIMYRGGAEQKIRKYLVDNNYVDAIVQLPSNLFLNVTISVDIMVLRKNKTDNGIMFVDASNEFVKVTKNNRLTEANIQRIVSAVAERKDVDHFCRLVPNDEVGNKENAYNLSVSTYVEAEDTREQVDIVKLNAEIAEIVAREAILRAEIDKIIAEMEVATDENTLEFMPLLSVADVLYGYPCEASLFNNDGEGLPLARIRDVLEGKTETYTTEQVPEKYLLSVGDLLIGMDGNFHVANWKTDGGILCQRVCKISSRDETVLLNGFLAHLLKPIIKKIEDSKQGGTVKHLLDRDIKAIVVPVPSLHVQNKIMRMLDNLEESTMQLRKNLETEFIARQKQYEYYRDKLLSFTEYFA